MKMPFSLFPLRRKRVRKPRPKTIRGDDTFLVSYPKSGNTWQRFLITALLRPDEEISFASVNSAVPDIHQLDDEALCRFPSPRILKSHEAYTPRYPRVIYVVRDPRSVAISLYHFMIRFEKVKAGHPMDDFVAGFIKGEYCREFGSWDKNVSGWISRIGGEGSSILLVRYEDLQRDTIAQLRRVAEFLGATPSENALSRAVQESSFQRLQRLEEERDRSGPDPTPSARPRFFRKGELEEWKSALSPAQKEMICEAFAEPMRRVGYL
jgi:hypothetical protein